MLGDDNILLKVTSITSDKQCEATVTKALKPLGEHYRVMTCACMNAVVSHTLPVHIAIQAQALSSALLYESVHGESDTSM